MLSKESLLEQLKFTLIDTNFDYLGQKYAGKVRDNYSTPDGLRVLISTDKLSAFDRNITSIPFKGEVLTQTSNFWFERTKHIIANHVVATPDPNSVVGIECGPLKIEFIVRGYITGSTDTSIWSSYQKGERLIYGIQFKDGLNKNDKLDAPIVTPTTKAPQGQHDERITRDEIISQGILSQEDYDYLAQKSVELYKFGVEQCAKNGLILMDTKYEFGRTKDGEIVLIDEIHTPDSSRFAIAATFEERTKAGLEPENLNKEFLRLWLANTGYKGEGQVPEIPDDVRVETAIKYIEAYEKITGQTFNSEVGDVTTRIDQNLKKHFNL